MPGMNLKSLNLTNPFVVDLFRHATFVTLLVWLGAIGAVILLVGLVTGRVFRFNSTSTGEAPARRFLRWSFGTLWLLDGLLQFQSAMPLGLGNDVVGPLRSGTPGWLHHLMSSAIAVWNAHPVTLAAGVSWLQVGLGVLLLTSSGPTSRVVGLLSALWAALIWTVGNGFGGVFAPGASLLFGWPGATIFYAYVGVWLAVDGERLRSRFPAVSRYVLGGLLAVGAILQVPPGTGFWRTGAANAWSSMASTMSAVAQPSWLASVVRGAGHVARVGGPVVNLVVISWMLVTAVGLVWRRVAGRRWPYLSLAIGAAVLWVLAQDAAVFGGLATDVNSLVPLGLVAVAAMPRLSGERLSTGRRHRIPREAWSSASAVAASFAAAAVIVAASAMAWAPFAGAETTMFLAQNGPATSTNVPARPFTLIDQNGASYTLGQRPDRVTVLTFLDPMCWTDCPLLDEQLKILRSELPARAPLDIVAVAADPYHETLANVRHFMSLHRLFGVKDFYFVTGKLPAVRAVWRAYGIEVTMKPTDRMSIHSDFMFIIRGGRIRWIIGDDPLSATSLTSSSVAELRHLLASEGIA